MLGLLFFSLVVSVLFLVWVWHAARWPNGVSWITSVCAVGFIFLAVTIVPAIQFLATFVFVGITRLAGGGTKAVRIASILAFLAAYGVAFGDGLVRRAELELVRHKFPVQSVADRLAYERKAEPITVSGIATLSLSPAVERRLLASEVKHKELTPRQSRLAYLHDRSYDAFILAPGFGSGRMPYIHVPPVALPEATPIAQPGSHGDWAVPYSPEVRDEPAEPIGSLAKGPGRVTVEALHSAGVDDFLTPDRLGYVKDRDHVVGFQSHQFQAAPELPTPKSNETEWRVVRLELLGLLKGPSPHVYVSEHLPRMDELKDAATRPLDEFEGRSLPKLRTDEDVVVEESPNVVRMLGSLRAGKTCVQCHSVERGELLGAFSYELRRTQPVPEGAKKTVAPSET